MKALLALVALPFLVPLSGCFTCQPTLEVRHCPDLVDVCAVRDGDRVLDWNADLASLWPDLPTMMGKAHLGHQHTTWTQNEADAFWTFWQVPAEQDDKQIFFVDGGQTYRVRILAC